MNINTDPENLEQMQWWTEARFGMFVHFGLYALLQRGEWVMYHEKIPRAEYEKLLHRFNPAAFDADAWVRLARDAGAKYITVTAKHHDGFCLFDSALTEFKITNTPFGRDLIGELVQACHRDGMRIVFYYSQPDWHHPAFVNRNGAFKEWQEPRPEDAPDWPAYQEYLEGQVRELCTNYGRIDGIWWDGSHRSEADWRGQHLYEMIKGYQPHAVVNDRARYGDFFTPERSIPQLPVGVPCECCQSVHTKSWGYREGGPYWSGPALVESLVKTASLGANFLLNVGPKPDGTISEPEAARMRYVGRWLAINGDAVYATEGCALDTGTPDIRATRQGKRLFLHLLRWPDTDCLKLPGIQNAPETVALLGENCELRTELDDDGLAIGPLPPAPATPDAHVLALDFSAAPELRLREDPAPEAPVIRLADSGVTRLGVADAAIAGYGVKATRLAVTYRTEDGGATVPVVANFLAESQTLSWRIHCHAPGRHVIAVETRISEPLGGSRLRVSLAGSSVAGTVDAGPVDPGFRRTDLGVIDIPAGIHEVVLQPESLALGYTLGGALRGLVLERE